MATSTIDKSGYTVHPESITIYQNLIDPTKGQLWELFVGLGVKIDDAHPYGIAHYFVTRENSERKLTRKVEDILEANYVRINFQNEVSGSYFRNIRETIHPKPSSLPISNPGPGRRFYGR